MKETIIEFINNLLPYDYILFGAILLLFILLLILAVVLRRSGFFSSLLIIIAFILVTAGPPVGYIQLHDYLFKHSISLTEIKELEFTDALIVWGTLQNHSKRTFASCKISAGVYKVAHNQFLDTLYSLNPFKKGSIVTDRNITVGNSYDFKIIIEPFHYTKDYNVSIGAACR